MIDPRNFKMDLKETERRLAENRAKIARQRKIIIQLAQDGADTAAAVGEMRNLLDSQKLHERRHRRILSDLVKTSKNS
jgi:multidrug resistance efflux pump